MLFNSLPFIAFFAACCAVYFLVPARGRWIVLLTASLFFYGWTKPTYLALLSATVISTWLGARKIDSLKAIKDRKPWMIFTVAFNVLILIIFKYLGFFDEIIQLFQRMLHHSSTVHLPELLLPIGISFYTFQAISYVLDVHFKIRKPEPHFGYYCTYVAYFPQILSGPISRADELLPQIKSEKQLLWADVEAGVIRFCWGLFKKLVIADRLGLIVDQVYTSPHNYQGSVLWFASLLYAFQLYADFSGYTDMAIGVSRILGIKLPENFDFPYIAKNITEFWRRWHLSLSNWLRDYLYTPIMFSKKKWGKGAIVYAIFITFLICGIWHGAKITFVIFGFLQGAALTWEMLTKDVRARWQKATPNLLYNGLSWLITFTFVVFCFNFFRANTTGDALFIAKREFTSFYAIGPLKAFIVQAGGIKLIFSLLLTILFFVCDKPATVFLTKKETVSWRMVVVSGMLLGLVMALGSFGKTDFIYFKF